MKLKSINMKKIFNVLGFCLIGAIGQSLHGEIWHCNVMPIEEILEIHNQISYKSCYPITIFEYEKLPLAGDHYLHPNKGFFHQTFILTIPHGQVFGLEGWVLINDSLIHELIWQGVYLSKSTLQEAKNNPPIIKEGRVAVIAQTGYNYYYHWMVEILGRLALLEMQNVEYDFLYVPICAPFMRETLELWGIDSSKIIEASDNCILIADQLIVPSLVSSASVNGCPRLVHYIPSNIVQYVRTKLLQNFDQKAHNYQFNNKVFISRQDASSRKILNEDEVFSLFEAQGFQRYYLTKMSVMEQIYLFKNAEIIVGSIGSGLTNLLFCNPEVQIIELYQARRDSTIWNLSQMLGLHKHTCIKTTEFIDSGEGQYDTIMPLDIIEEVITQLRY